MNNVNNLFAILGVNTVDVNGNQISYDNIVASTRTNFLALTDEQRADLTSLISSAKKEIEVAYDAVNGLTDIIK